MLYIELAIVVALILMNGLLALAELAIVSSRRARLQALVDRGVIGSRRALALTTNPGRFLSTVQVGITLVGVLSGAFSGATLGLRLAEWFVDCGHYLLLVGDWRASAEADCAARSGKNRGPGGACHDGHGDDCVAHRLVPGFFWARGFKRAGISGPARAP